MKTYLITGGLGFIGSNFIQLLYKKYGYNIRVINIDKDTLNRKNHEHLKHIPQINNTQNYLYKEADIADFDKIQSLIFLYQPDKIINFAAESHVDVSIQFPQKHAHTNIIGTISLLIAASKYYNVILNEEKKKQFVFHHISTDQVFGDLPVDSIQKFNEYSYYNPSSPYSATKASSDFLVKAWGRTYGLPWTISNCSNNYGKYQDNSKLIPKVINQCLNNQPITIHGTGQYIRDWIHVEDHCLGILEMIQNLDISMNKQLLFGGDCQKTNNWIVNYICEIFDKYKPINNKSYKDLIIHIENRRGQDNKYAIDNTNTTNTINWKPSCDIYKQLLQLVIDTLNIKDFNK